MIVRLDATSVSITEADDCRRLHVATTLAAPDIDDALRASGIGRRGDGGDALLDVARLHGLAKAAATADDWDDNWSAMIGYATTKGWVTDEGRTVAAHIESGT